MIASEKLKSISTLTTCASAWEHLCSSTGGDITYTYIESSDVDLIVESIDEVYEIEVESTKEGVLYVEDAAITVEIELETPKEIEVNQETNEINIDEE